MHHSLSIKLEFPHTPLRGVYINNILTVIYVLLRLWWSLTVLEHRDPVYRTTRYIAYPAEAYLWRRFVPFVSVFDRVFGTINDRRRKHIELNSPKY